MNAAIATKSTINGKSATAISLNGTRGICIGGYSVWDGSDDWDEECEEMYKRVIDRGDAVLDAADLPCDMRDELHYWRAVLVDSIK